ncbi:MAG: hypothetical protein ABUL72_01665 [Armatimonadota bacterium]
MKNNQKTLIVAALAVVLLGVGAFTFLPQLTAPKPTVVAVKTAPAVGTPTTADTKVPESPGKPVVGDSIQTPASVPGTGDPNAPIDPTKAPTDPTKAPSDPALKPDGTKPEESSKLRDPFAKPSNVSGFSSNLANAPVTPAGVKPATPLPGTPGASSAPRSGGSQPWLQPLNPGGGSLPAIGSTPLPMGGGGGSLPTAAAATPKGPRYKLKGVLRGTVNVAVFEDSDGNQRMVRVGEQCDAKTKVTGISQGKVTVKEDGKDKTLVIEEQTG